MLRYVINRGYRVIDGQVWHPDASAPRKLQANRGGYLVFSAGSRKEGTRGTAYVHRLAAWQKFGDEIFSWADVRHLDGDKTNNRPENLVLGTRSENMMDRDATDRVAHARKAARVQRKMTDKQVAQLRKDRVAGATYAVLMQKYGISKTAVSYIVNHKTYCAGGEMVDTAS